MFWEGLPKYSDLLNFILVNVWASFLMCSPVLTEISSESFHTQIRSQGSITLLCLPAVTSSACCQRDSRAPGHLYGINFNFEYTLTCISAVPVFEHPPTIEKSFEVLKELRLKEVSCVLLTLLIFVFLFAWLRLNWHLLMQ